MLLTAPELLLSFPGVRLTSVICNAHTVHGVVAAHNSTRSIVIMIMNCCFLLISVVPPLPPSPPPPLCGGFEV